MESLHARAGSTIIRWTALALASVSLALLPQVVAPSVAHAAACTPTAILENPCRPWVGAASNSYVSGFRNSILNHENRAGRQMEIVHSYHQPGEVLTSDELTLARRANTTALINYKPSSSWASASGGNATVNTQIDRMADSIKSLGSTKVLLTIFHEPENDVSRNGNPDCPNVSFNGNSGTTAQYVSMWHNVRARFDARGVNNVVWVMNYMGWQAWLCTVDGLWPGNEYVDWVMWDPYPGNNKTYRTFVSEMYNHLVSHSNASHDYLSKPWGLAEYGYVGSSQTQAYRFYDDIRSGVTNNWFPKLRAYVNWDGKALHDNRVQYNATGQTDQAEQTRYNALVNDPLLRDPASTPDTTQPTVTLSSPGAIVSGSVLVAGTATDNVGVVQVQLLVDDTVVASGTVGSDGAVSIPWNTASTANGTYSLRLRASDSAGNVGNSATVSVTVNNAGGEDTQVPTAASGLTATAGGTVAAPQVSLTWVAASDNVGVTGYSIYRNGNFLTEVGAVTSYVDTTVSAATAYTYFVRARDAAGGVGPASNTASATTPSSAPDTTAPSRPSGLVAIPGTRQITLTWNPSTDNVGVVTYYLFRGNVRYRDLPSSQTTFIDTGLTTGAQYTYKIYASDARNNWSPSSGSVSARAG